MRLLKTKKIKVLIVAVVAVVASAFTTNVPKNTTQKTLDEKHRTVTLCRIDGHGSNASVNCDWSGEFYYETEIDWEGRERFVSGYVMMNVDGESRRLQAYENPRGGVRGNYKYKAGSYYFN